MRSFSRSYGLVVNSSLFGPSCGWHSSVWHCFRESWVWSHRVTSTRTIKIVVIMYSSLSTWSYSNISIDSYCGSWPLLYLWWSFPLFSFVRQPSSCNIPFEWQLYFVSTFMQSLKSYTFIIQFIWVWTSSQLLSVVLLWISAVKLRNFDSLISKWLYNIPSSRFRYLVLVNYHGFRWICLSPWLSMVIQLINTFRNCFLSYHGDVIDNSSISASLFLCNFSSESETIGLFVMSIHSFDRS